MVGMPAGVRSVSESLPQIVERRCFALLLALVLAVVLVLVLNLMDTLKDAILDHDVLDAGNHRAVLAVQVARLHHIRVVQEARQGFLLVTNLVSALGERPRTFLLLVLFEQRMVDCLKALGFLGLSQARAEFRTQTLLPLNEAEGCG